jgi:heme exporter protein C
MIYRVFLIVLGICSTVAYFWAPPAKGFLHPESAKILFFHAPEAMLCSLFFLWGAMMAIGYLRTRDLSYDRRSFAAIEVGLLLASLATLTGMVFAEQQWGVIWDWDVRQTSIFIQILIYAAYFALRMGFTDREMSAGVSAGYAIFAFLTVPILIWILPRVALWPSKHAGANQAVVGGGLDMTYRLIFYLCVISIGLTAVWCYKLRVRETTEKDQQEVDDVLASGDPYSTDSGVVRPVRLRRMD